MSCAVKAIGREPFIYSSDFPHEVTNESCKEEIHELLENEELTAEDKAAILHGNAQALLRPQARLRLRRGGVTNRPTPARGTS